MRSRFHWWFPLMLAVVLSVPSVGLGLEKSAALARASADPNGGWRSATSCSVFYYNICTGWIWNWSGWKDGDTFGVVFDHCCGEDNATLESVSIYVWTGAPAGYGFTGLLEVYDVDADRCPTGPALHSQAWLPPTAYVEVPLGSGVPVPGPSVAVAVRIAADQYINESAFTSDHPGAVDPEPPACGLCYPTTRVNHSYYWGTPATVVCPGEPFFDDTCDAQLWWEATFTCTPVSVEPASWGSLKALYR